MKKIVFVAIALVVYTATSAQVDKNALGLRLGGGNFSGGELSYQLGVSNVNRFEFDAGFNFNDFYDALGLTATYQWVWDIGTEGLNWYAGPGAGLSMFSGKKGYGNYTGISVGGQVGLGYNFRVPVQLTLDTRPMWALSAKDGVDAFGWGIALGVRYRF